MSGAHGGIHCVVYALFDARERLDRGAMREQVARLLAAGVDGITVLGLATEVQKLGVAERHAVIEWAAADIGGRVPLSVTVAGDSVAAQRETVGVAEAHDAALVILQPPAVGAYGADAYIDFFARVAENSASVFAIQNAPQYLGRGLAAGDVARLAERIERFRVIKAEMSAVDLSALRERCGPGLTYLNGRAGLEMTDCLRAGAQGFLLAADTVDHAKRVFDLWQAAERGGSSHVGERDDPSRAEGRDISQRAEGRDDSPRARGRDDPPRSGDRDAADAAFAALLPAIVFSMQSIEHLVCYGKRMFGHRTGLPVHDRAPALAPTEFGEDLARRWAARLGPFPR